MNKKDVLGFGLLPGIPKKMESIPHWMESRFCAKGEIYFSWIKRLFWWYLRQLSRPDILLLFQYVYSADFCRN